MIMHDVESSMMSSIGYDADTQTMAIRFTSGDLYHYENVSQATYQALAHASSKGKHFGKVIAPHHKGVKQHHPRRHGMR